MELQNGDRPKKKLITPQMRIALLEGEQHITVDRSRPLISVITLNRPESKNLMTHRTRAQLFNQLQLNDQDPDVRVTIIRGAGGNFCAGNDFDSNRDETLPFFEAEIDGQTSRHILNGWFMMNDLAKPSIAMVEGEAMGGGLELAAACDVCLCAEDAMIGYSSVRGQGLPDYQILPWMTGMRNAMELMLTNTPMTGIEAVRRRFATAAYPAAMLEEKTFDLAARVAQIPSDLLAFNKKSVHRAFEAMNMRTNLRNAQDLEALMFKANGAKMLTARRGPAAMPGKAAQRVAPPRPGGAAKSPAAVGTQAVSATASTPTPMEAKPAGPSSPSAASKSSEAVPSKPIQTATAKGSQNPAPKTTSSAATSPKIPPVSSKSQAPLSASAKPSTATAMAKTPAKAPVKAQAPVRKPAPQQGEDIASDEVDVVKTAPVQKIPSAPAPRAATAPKSVAPAAAPVKAATTPKKASTGEDVGGVHVHLHEAVHIHIGPKTPSKL